MVDFIEWRKCTGIEPAQQLFTATLVLKTRRPTRRLGTSDYSDILAQIGLVCKKLNEKLNHTVMAPVGHISWQQ